MRCKNIGRRIPKNLLESERQIFVLLQDICCYIVYAGSSQTFRSGLIVNCPAIDFNAAAMQQLDGVCIQPFEIDI